VDECKPLLMGVLRDALGGNCKTVMIACVWPDVSHVEETVSTCRFASRVRTLTTNAVINESKDPNVLVRKYEVGPTCMLDTCRQ
jgi:kinesin family protein 6/9